MWQAIGMVAAAAIALIGTIITVVATVRKGNKDILNELKRQTELSDQKLEAKLEKFQAVTDTRLEELTREVRKHNGFAERMPVVENDIKNLYKLYNRSGNDGK